MAINWNPLNIEKPQFVSAKEVMDNMRGMRDQRAKFATEQAMRSSLTSAGDIDPTAMRQSLINQGFGELADQAVSQAMSTRRKDVGDVAELGYKIQAMVQAGMIEPERARELFNNISSVKAVPAKSEQPDISWAEGIPASTTTPQDSSVDGTVHITATSESLPAENEYIRTEKKAQIAPEYASDLFKFEKLNDSSLGDVSVSGGGVSYQLPTSGDDRSDILSSAKLLGIKVPDNISDEDFSKIVMTRASQGVVIPSRAEFMSGNALQDQSNYYKAYREAHQKILDNAYKIISDLESGAQTQFTRGITKQEQARAEEQLGMSQEAQRYALAGQKDQNIFAREVNPTEAADVRRFRSSIVDIATAQPTPESMYTAALAKAKADGSVSQESILANLAGMGFRPSPAMIDTRFLMDGSGNLTSTGMNLLKQAWAEMGGRVDSKVFSSWQKRAVDNVNDQITDAGGRPFIVGSSQKGPGVKNPTADIKPGSEKPKAVQYLKSKGVDSNRNKYSETKTNAAGMKMGRRSSDGKWEPIK